MFLATRPTGQAYGPASKLPVVSWSYVMQPTVKLHRATPSIFLRSNNQQTTATACQSIATVDVDAGEWATAELYPGQPLVVRLAADRESTLWPTGVQQQPRGNFSDCTEHVFALHVRKLGRVGFHPPNLKPQTHSLLGHEQLKPCRQLLLRLQALLPLLEPTQRLEVAGNSRHLRCSAARARLRCVLAAADCCFLICCREQTHNLIPLLVNQQLQPEVCIHP